MTGFTKEELENSLSHIDVTDKIEVYEKGKTFECNCGQGIGVRVSRPAVKCEKCERVCVDRKADSRANRQETDDDNNDGLDIDLTDFID